jgi:hypothetical protein
MQPLVRRRGDIILRSIEAFARYIKPLMKLLAANKAQVLQMNDTSETSSGLPDRKIVLLAGETGCTPAGKIRPIRMLANSPSFGSCRTIACTEL